MAAQAELGHSFIELRCGGSHPKPERRAEHLSHWWLNTFLRNCVGGRFAAPSASRLIWSMQLLVWSNSMMLHQTTQPIVRTAKKETARRAASVLTLGMS